jgi:carbamoylphosphate synthase large subunit
MTHERLVFGVTIDQIDELNSLLRTIAANGDAVTVCHTEDLQPQSVSTLGEAVFNAALAVRQVFDQIEEQKL